MARVPHRHSTIAALSGVTMGTRMKGEKKVNISRRQLHDLDRGHCSPCWVQKMQLRLEESIWQIVSPSDSTHRLPESVTEAHGSAQTWSDGKLTTLKSRQDLRRWLNQYQLRCVWFCCPEENILPRSDTKDTNPLSSSLEINASNDTLPLLQQKWF